MSTPYVIRIPVQLAAPLSEAEEHLLEQRIQRHLAATGTPLTAGDTIDCVEVFQACPCCDQAAVTCGCRWATVRERECLVHNTRVPEGDH